MGKYYLDKWQKVAISEGRICPECKQPVSKKNWEEMNRDGKVSHCLSCRLAHWEVPVENNDGSVAADNADRDALVRIREGG